MPWYLDEIGGRPTRPAAYRYGLGQGLPRDINYHTLVPDQSLWPISLHQTNTVKSTLDFEIGPTTGIVLVSAKFKRLVEDFEPGVHFFIPVTMHHKDGSLNTDERFMFKPGHILDQSIVIAESELNERVMRGKVVRYGPTSQTPRIMWKHSAVAGKHLWIDRLLRNAITVSDEFYSEAKARDLKGWLAIEGRINPNE